MMGELDIARTRPSQAMGRLQGANRQSLMVHICHCNMHLYYLRGKQHLVASNPAPAEAFLLRQRRTSAQPRQTLSLSAAAAAAAAENHFKCNALVFVIRCT